MWPGIDANATHEFKGYGTLLVYEDGAEAGSYFTF